MKNFEPKVWIEDPWETLKKYTQARIAIGRCGSSIPTAELLQFKLSHAKAIDAVHLPFPQEQIAAGIEDAFGLDVLRLHSAARDRSEYLRRPDLGRELSDESIRLLQNSVKPQHFDISLVVADGLSSTAIERNIQPVLQLLIPMLNRKKYSLSPVTVVQQGRVAIADSIAELFRARLTVIFIGERPGLKSPDSLGIYMTYKPRKGTTDERRNCISNVREDGLSYPVACSKLLYLIEESFKRSLSGVELKDEQVDILLEPVERNMI
jgi:ethanolamine ammonia-lyase small subunit